MVLGACTRLSVQHHGLKQRRLNGLRGCNHVARELWSRWGRRMISQCRTQWSRLPSYDGLARRKLSPLDGSRTHNTAAVAAACRRTHSGHTQHDCGNCRDQPFVDMTPPILTIHRIPTSITKADSPWLPGRQPQRSCCFRTWPPTAGRVHNPPARDRAHPSR